MEKKFLFDLNKFEGDQDLAALEGPPTFSVEEMEAMRAKAFEDGKRTGLKESAASREQEIAGLVGIMVDALNTLQNHEEERTRQYEQDVISLIGQICALFLPATTEKMGKAELMAQAEALVKKLDAGASLQVICHNSVKEEFSALLERHNLPRELVEIISKPDISETSLEMVWNKGGAIIDLERKAGEISAALEEMLALAPQKPHTVEQSDFSDSGDPTDE